MNHLLNLYIILLLSLFSGQSFAQIEKHYSSIDTETTAGKKPKKAPAKVLHAEPLYIDLIRDLGARKGEKEWNVGLGITDNENYDRYETLVEYEWAPINRLGLEVELPFSFYYPTNENGEAPSSKLNSLKLAAQYSFFVSEKHQTSIAIGYIHEFELTTFRQYHQERLLQGNTYNPFLIVARGWGQHLHTLLYTGPVIHQPFGQSATKVVWQINSNIHHMIPGTKNFIGAELNKTIDQGQFALTIRPQMRVSLTNRLLVGIVVGIPTQRKNERLSSFLRLIYEPGHKK